MNLGHALEMAKTRHRMETVPPRPDTGVLFPIKNRSSVCKLKKCPHLIMKQKNGCNRSFCVKYENFVINLSMKNTDCQNYVIGASNGTESG